MNKAIVKAVEITGSQVKLARTCNVSQPAVKKWLNGGGISAEYLLKIERATGGQVTVMEICESLEKE